MKKRLVLIALGIALPTCTPVFGSFVCRTDAECGTPESGARCEANGLCSAKDTSCPTGARFASGAREPAGTCVPCVLEVRAGGFDEEGHTCARLVDGTVWCWGSGKEGQLGSPVLDRGPALLVPNVSGAAGISLGASHTCAWNGAGEVKCWGGNRYGQLGSGAGNPDGRASAAAVVTPKAQSVVSGAWATCALSTPSAASCWGKNGAGELRSLGAVTSTPGLVDLPSGAVKLVMGSAHACALTDASRVSCWGSTTSGQTGDGTLVSVEGAVQLAAGSEHTCALREDRTVWCWGRGHNGRLGNAKSDAVQAAPLKVEGLAPAAEISAGFAHTCARVDDGSVWCWGDGMYGQLGNGATADSTSPVKVHGISDAVQLSAGYRHTCAVRKNGEVWCWGSNATHELGAGTDAISAEPLRAGITCGI